MAQWTAISPSVSQAEAQATWTAEDWADYERLGHMLQRSAFRLATTMRSNPHHYTVRNNWKDFDWAVVTLRRLGYTSIFGGKPYVQVDINEHFYWTMGAPVEETILINRKRLKVSSAYDEIASRYDIAFRDPDSLAEDAKLMNRLDGLVPGRWSHLNVLDVGCGMGLLLRYRAPGRYLGIDPSAAMLQELRHRHPASAVIHTPLRRFVPPMLVDEHGAGAPGNAERYDAVTALYGTGSYLSDAELSRIPSLLRTGGRAVVMFYAPGYTPVTYERTKASASPIPRDDDSLRALSPVWEAAAVEEIGSYRLWLLDATP